MQVAAKLQLVSAFVAAHATAQQLISAHLATNSHPAPSDMDNSSSKSTSDMQPEGSAAQASNNNGLDKAPLAVEFQVAGQVLQESRAEADAALQYGHKVRQWECGR